jgi:hypothetical protein
MSASDNQFSLTRAASKNLRRGKKSPSGTITVTAAAENLASGIVTLIAQPPKKK